MASTLGTTIRSDVANQDFNVAALQELDSDGTQGSVNGTIAPNTNLVINVPSGSTPAADLFLGGGFSFIQNYNDTAPIIATGTDANTTEIVYEGDTAGQSFYAGSGTEDAAFAGYGNLFVGSSVSGATYEVSAGLVGNPTLAFGAFNATDLAPAPTPGGAASGNTVVAGAGNASIAAGLGSNQIFLGSGTALVASEGNDAIVANSGAATIDGGGAATVYAGTGALSFFGSGGTGVIYGGSDSTSGAINVLGGSASVTVYGGAGTLSASGGLAGNNVLVGGSGSSTLFGGATGDTLVAGTGSSVLVAGTGNETLFGGGSSGTTDFFLGAGADNVVAGSGTDFVQFAAGSSTVYAGTGTDTFGVVNAPTGGSNLVVGFNSASDFINLSGFDPSVTGASVVASDTVTGGSTFFSLPSDTATFELYGVTNLTAANFT